MLSRPAENEYAPYYGKYISRVPDGDLLNFMELQTSEFNGFVNDLTDEQTTQPPAPGKWSVKQVLGHICDSERVFAYRAVRFARADKTDLEGFEQDDYVASANSNARSATELLAELKSVRGATLSLLESLTEADTIRTGVASGNPVSVRALAYIIGGHAQHHLELLRKQFAR
jgi:uncharacterized damage-inducible protein DinB